MSVDSAVSDTQQTINNQGENTMTDIETLARQRLALIAQREAIDARVKDIDAQIIDAIEIGGHIDIDGQPAFRVQQKRTFSLDLARQVVPQSLLDAATVSTIDATALKKMLPPVLADACMKPGATFVAKAGR